MSKPAVLAGVASLIVIVALLFRFGRDKQTKSASNESTASGTAGAMGSASQTSGTQTPDNIGKESPPQTSYEFGWVDGNDKQGKQFVVSVIYDKTNGGFGKTTELVFEKGKTYNFEAKISGWDAEKVAVGLGGWGYSWHIFAPDSNSLANGKGTLMSNGYDNFLFKITPAYPGVYRFRVAIGDAADEDALVFRMPASVSPAVAVGFNQLR